jgi:hypothetical protein
MSSRRIDIYVMRKIILPANAPHLRAYITRLLLCDDKPADMIMKLVKNKTINELWQEFNNAYPFLRIDFYKYAPGRPGSTIKQKLNKSTLLGNAAIRREGEIEISGTMTVRQLENIFLDHFGVPVQVSRKSGTIWLETTISDNWTLKQQNDHGRELSEPVKKDMPLDQTDYD